MTKEHIIREERVLRDWYNSVIIIQVWAPLSLSGIMELPHTLFTGSKTNLSWFLSRKVGKYIGS